MGGSGFAVADRVVLLRSECSVPCCVMGVEVPAHEEIRRGCVCEEEGVSCFFCWGVYICKFDSVLVVSDGEGEYTVSLFVQDVWG